MRKVFTLLLLCICIHASQAQTASLVDVAPDSAFQGQNLPVTVTYPYPFILVNASPGEYINFSGPGLSNFNSSWATNINFANNSIEYEVTVPLSATPGIYDVSAYLGHYDAWNPWQFVIDSTYVLPQSFIIVEANVYGRLFIDVNGNGIYEPLNGESVYRNKRIDVSPDNISVYTDNNGMFLLGLSNGTHTVQYTPNPGETITTGNSPQVVNVTTGSVQNIGDIGVLNPSYYEIFTWASLSRRCNRVQYGTLYLSNYSNRTVNVELTFVKSSNIDFRSSVPPPTSISGDTVRWSISNMLPGSNSNIVITDSMPSAGDIIEYSLTAIAFDGIVPVDTAFRLYQSTVSCAYDPNDKSVNPGGISIGNYTLIGEDLYYHINFQNTGNDTAFDVIIKDTLDSDLDLNTFTFLGSSSPAIVKIDNNTRIVEFKMNNILLPDSNVNEPASHGFVDYKINHVTGILDGTEITNTAYIYFDFNPPIATNSTLNTMLSFVPVGIPDPVADNQVMVFPNPFNNTAKLIIKSWQGETYTLKIWNELGELMMTKSISSEETILSKDALASGIYFYQLESINKSLNGKFVITEE